MTFNRPGRRLVARLTLANFNYGIDRREEATKYPCSHHPHHYGSSLLLFFSHEGMGTGELPVDFEWGRVLDDRLVLAYRLGIGVLIADLLVQWRGVSVEFGSKYESTVHDAVAELAACRLDAPLPKATTTCRDMLETLHTALLAYINDRHGEGGWGRAVVRGRAPA